MSQNPVVDPMSRVLAVMRARCVVTGGLRAGGDWSFRFFPSPALKIDAVVRGSCWLVADPDPPILLRAGDAVVLNGVSSAVLCSDPAVAFSDRATADGSVKTSFMRVVGDGEGTVVVGGHVALDPAATDLFQAGLPRLLHAEASGREAARTRLLLEEMTGEAEDGLPGAAFALDQYAQLLLVQALRVGLRSPGQAPAGWLALAADPQLGPALALMYDDPAHRWTLPELAAAAQLSRSQFAVRFRAVAGEPPVAHLTRWRVHLAQRALRTSDATVAELSRRLGYASDSSFTHAFTRVTGTSPTGYRQLSHGHPPGVRKVDPWPD